MYDYIKGKLTRIEETTVVVERGMIGYAVQVSDTTLSTLQAQGDAEVCLYLHQVVRDDAFTLYGFITLQERALFRRLIGVPGVGPSTARVILSSHSVADIVVMVAEGDHSALKRVKGIGEKTAQRIVVELQKSFMKLRDEYRTTGASTARGRRTAPTEGIRAEALSALTSLGFNKNSTEKALDALLAAEEITTVEHLIKRALQTM